MAKKIQNPITNAQQAEQVVMELNKIDYLIAQFEAKETTAQLKVREKFHTGIIGEARAVYAARKKELETQLKGFSESDRENWGKAKTVETTFGNYGFRINPPSVALIKSICKNFDEALEKVKQSLPKYVRNKYEIDKEKILQNYKKLDLESVGLKIENKDKFFVKTVCEENLEKAREKLKSA